MAAYSLDNMLRLWALSQLTPEQAIGQILQVLGDIEPRVTRLEQARTSPQHLPPAAPTQPAADSVPRETRPRKRKPRRRAR
jgi:hypothetical protein